MSVDLAAIVVGAIFAGLTTGMVLLFAGIQRIPWRFGALIALGVGVVMLAGTLANAGWPQSGQAAAPVLLAAIGGGIAVRGYERGKAQRDAVIETIVGQR